MRVQIDRFAHDYERGPATLQEFVAKGYMGTIPPEPFTGSNQTWQVETADPAQAAVESPRSENPTVRKALTVSTPSPGIVDVHCGAEGQGLDGTDNAKWLLAAGLRVSDSGNDREPPRHQGTKGERYSAHAQNVFLVTL